MTALTDREFHTALDELAPTTAFGLPATHVQGECDTCGVDSTVRVTPTGLACEDCYDAEPEPYDPSDCYERADAGWGWD